MVLRADECWGWAEMSPHFTSTGDFVEAGQNGILRRLLSDQVCNVLDDVLPVKFSYFGRVGVYYWLRVIFVANFGWGDWRPWLFNLAEHFRQLLQPYFMHLAFINLLFFALFFSLVYLAFLLLLFLLQKLLRQHLWQLGRLLCFLLLFLLLALSCLFLLDSFDYSSVFFTTFPSVLVTLLSPLVNSRVNPCSVWKLNIGCDKTPALLIIIDHRPNVALKFRF